VNGSADSISRLHLKRGNLYENILKFRRKYFNSRTYKEV